MNIVEIPENNYLTITVSRTGTGVAASDAIRVPAATLGIVMSSFNGFTTTILQVSHDGSTWVPFAGTGLATGTPKILATPFVYIRVHITVSISGNGDATVDFSW